MDTFSPLTLAAIATSLMILTAVVMKTRTRATLLVARARSAATTNI